MVMTESEGGKPQSPLYKYVNLNISNRDLGRRYLSPAASKWDAQWNI